MSVSSMFNFFSVHLSRRLTCTMVRRPSFGIRRPSVVVNFSHFNFFTETVVRNSKKFDRKQDLNILYQVCVFQADQKNKMATVAYDWLRHFEFRLLLWNCLLWNSTKLDRKQDLNVLYKVCVFPADWKKRWLSWPLIGWDISTSPLKLLH